MKRKPKRNGKPVDYLEDENSESHTNEKGFGCIPTWPSVLESGFWEFGGFVCKQNGDFSELCSLKAYVQASTFTTQIFLIFIFPNY